MLLIGDLVRSSGRCWSQTGLIDVELVFVGGYNSEWGLTVFKQVALVSHITD